MQYTLSLHNLLLQVYLYNRSSGVGLLQVCMLCNLGDVCFGVKGVVMRCVSSIILWRCPQTSFAVCAAYTNLITTPLLITFIWLPSIYLRWHAYSWHCNVEVDGKYPDPWNVEVIKGRACTISVYQALSSPSHKSLAMHTNVNKLQPTKHAWYLVVYDFR